MNNTTGLTDELLIEHLNDVIFFAEKFVDLDKDIAKEITEASKTLELYESVIAEASVDIVLEELEESVAQLSEASKQAVKDKFDKMGKKIKAIFEKIANFIKQTIYNHMDAFSMSIEKEDDVVKVKYFKYAVKGVATKTLEDDTDYYVLNIYNLHTLYLKFKKELAKNRGKMGKAMDDADSKDNSEVDAAVGPAKALDDTDLSFDIFYEKKGKADEVFNKAKAITGNMNKFYPKMIDLMYKTSNDIVKKEAKKLETSAEYRKYLTISRISRHCMNVNNLIKKI